MTRHPAEGISLNLTLGAERLIELPVVAFHTGACGTIRRLVNRCRGIPRFEHRNFPSWQLPLGGGLVSSVFGYVSLA